jgi:hypothetical protein
LVSHCAEQNASKEEAAQVQDSNGGNLRSPKFDEEPDNERDSSELYVSDRSFALDKSPNQDGALANEKAPGAVAGLGEGTPKVYFILITYWCSLTICLYFNCCSHSPFCVFQTE